MVTGSVVRPNQQMGETPGGGCSSLARMTHRERGQGGPLPLMSRGQDGQRCRAHSDGGLTWYPVVRARHCTGHVPAHRAASDGLPEIPGLMVYDGGLPESGDVTWAARRGKQVVAIRFPIRHGDHRHVRWNGLLGGCERCQPTLALLVCRGPLSPLMPFTTRRGVTAPNVLVDQTQGPPSLLTASAE